MNVYCEICGKELPDNLALSAHIDVCPELEKVMTVISWNDIDEDYKCIETPFDIESILRTDSKLLEQWKRKPFYLDIDSNGDLVIKYIDKVLI